jgi:hypothetical protein
MAAGRSATGPPAARQQRFSPLDLSLGTMTDEGAKALTRRLWADGQAVMTALSRRAVS